MANRTVRSTRLWRSLTMAFGVALAGSFLATDDVLVFAKDPPSASAPAKAVEPKKTAPAGAGSLVGLEQVRQINELVAAQWKANNLIPSNRASDYEFVRRASLDIVGRIARPKEIEHFLKDPPQTRRSQLIERLLESDEYAKNWANIWTVWLMTRSANRTYQEQMQLWLEEQFSKNNHGWDKIVNDLITATGQNNENGSVNFILQHLGEVVPPGKIKEEGHFEFVPITSRVTRLFLGLQTQCTQCHDHPFNPQWKQNHFWGMNAFFRQVNRTGTPNMGRQMNVAAKLGLKDDVSVNDNGIVFYEKRNGVVLPTKPAFLDGKDKKWNASGGQSRRQQLADYVTKSEYFGKAYANRVWGHFFSKGLTSPGAMDDFGEHNPTTNPELLDYLAAQFKHYGHNPRDLIRWICNSEAYGLTSMANKSNEKSDADPFFSRMLLKTMSPEELFESLMVATQAEAAETRDSKKKLREDWMKNLIVQFGDDEGNEVTFNGTVVQALMLMNGKEINAAISTPGKGTVAQAWARTKGNHKGMMDSLFLAALNRYPTAKEASVIATKLRGRDRDPIAPWYDLFWALLNSNEFMLNH